VQPGSVVATTSSNQTYSGETGLPQVPMASLRRRENSAGDNRWYAVDRLVVRGVPERLDLDRWLEESGQRAGLEAALPPLDRRSTTR